MDPNGALLCGRGMGRARPGGDAERPMRDGSQLGGPYSSPSSIPMMW